MPLFLLLRLLLLSLPVSQAFAPLSDSSLKNLPSPGTDYDVRTGKILAPILIPRVPGTEGSTKVLNHLVDFFKNDLPAWNIELQNSTSKTPATGDADIPFVNFWATRDPPWAQEGEVGRLVLVAHYDSKLTPHGFIGATDSAAPCAMMMHVARSIDNALTAKWKKMQADGKTDVKSAKGVRILFLDGEEAFISWTHTDSLYGARSLAAEWESTPHPALSTYRTPLSSISLFLLLDLLGASNPSVPSYFKQTHWAYQQLAGLESRMRSLGLFLSSPTHSTKQKNKKNTRAEPETPWLRDADKAPDTMRAFMIEDDHIPFLARGVGNILHMIPTPFPRVWHEMDDDGEHLDLNTVDDWARLVTAFTASWMELDEFMGAKRAAKREKRDLEKEEERGWWKWAPTPKTKTEL